LPGAGLDCRAGEKLCGNNRKPARLR